MQIDNNTQHCCVLFFMKSIFKNSILYVLCILIVLSFSGVVRYYKYRDGIAILGYHHIVSDMEKEKYYKHNIYVMGVSDFEEQLIYLKKHGYLTLSMKQLQNYYEGKLEINKPSVVLTFDDGIDSFNEYVKPLMEKYDMKATCFVIGRKTQLENKKEEGKYSYLKVSDMINDDHVEYYSHSYNLHHKAGLLKKQMEVESYDFIMNDFKSNESIVSDEYFAFPFGRSSKNAKRVLKERDVQLAFGYGQNRKMISKDDRYLLPRFIMYDFLPIWAFRLYVG